MGKMAEMQRRLLEQMMGAEAMGLVVTTYEWWDERVCRDFLFGSCPHVLFSNTKMDLGPCPRLHSDKILSQFQEHMASQPNDGRIAAFRQQHENTLYGFIDDCDRRIRAAQRKLEKTPEENRKTVDLMREIGEIELSIQGGTEEIEALGEAGKVEESMQKLAAVDALKAEKSAKERELQDLNENAGASGHQKLRVCEICGAMLSVLDSDKRLADHFGGKLHLGYQELRKLIAAMAEARMTGRGAPGPPPPSGPPMGAPSAPSGPRGPPPSAPSGPASNGFMAPPHNAPLGPGRRNDDPHTPMHAPRVPPSDEMPAVGHGDKHRREAGELVDDVKEEKHREDGEEYGRGDRYRDREREKDRYGDRERDSRDDRYGDREKERERYGDRKDRDRERGERDSREDRYEKYDKYENRSSRYDDRERDRDRKDRDRDRKYEDERSSSKYERSRSPPKRRLV